MGADMGILNASDSLSSISDQNARDFLLQSSVLPRYRLLSGWPLERDSDEEAAAAKLFGKESGRASSSGFKKKSSSSGGTDTSVSGSGHGTSGGSVSGSGEGRNSRAERLPTARSGGGGGSSSGRETSGGGSKTNSNTSKNDRKVGTISSSSAASGAGMGGTSSVPLFEGQHTAPTNEEAPNDEQSFPFTRHSQIPRGDLAVSGEHMMSPGLRNYYKAAAAAQKDDAMSAMTWSAGLAVPQRPTTVPALSSSATSKDVRDGGDPPRHRRGTTRSTVIGGALQPLHSAGGGPSGREQAGLSASDRFRTGFRPVSDRFQTGVRSVPDQCHAGYAQSMSQCHVGSTVHVTMSCQICGVMSNLRSVTSDAQES